MAKFGQLYLQGGRTNPSTDERVISQKWIDASFTDYVVGTNDMLPTSFSYGYFFYNMLGSAWCAVGSQGQYICVDRDLGRVVIQQRDIREGGNFENSAVPTALDGSLSFRVDAVDDGVLGSSHVSIEEY